MSRNAKVLHCDIEVPGDFELVSGLSYLSKAPGVVFESVTLDRFRKAFYLSESEVPVLLSVYKTPAFPSVRVELYGETISDEDLIGVRERVEECFYVSPAPSGLFDLFIRDKILGSLYSRYGLIRPFLYFEPFEAFLWAIAAQQVNVGFAKTLLFRLHGALGGKHLEFEGVTYPLSPNPREVASLSMEELRECKFSGTKAKALLEISRAVADKEIDFSVMKLLDYDTVMASFTKYHGVGRWTAEYVLLRGLGFDDVFPSGDLGLRKAVANLYGLEGHFAEETIRSMSSSWSPYRGWISQLLFYHLNASR